MDKKKTSIFGFFGSLGIFFLGAFLWINSHILSYDMHVISPTNVTPSSTVLVFGGGMEKDGSMSVAQTERVRVAVNLYDRGVVDRIILTGDDGARRFNEVDAMAAYAVARGVPEGVIDIDQHGDNTYTSCYRAYEEKLASPVVVISQSFHLSRILYFCRGFGLSAKGVVAPLGDQGFRGVLWSTNIREKLARIKGWWQMEITKPAPLMFYK